jgi:TIR domain
MRPGGVFSGESAMSPGFFVFLSHASVDDRLANRLRQSLQKRSIRCWLDHVDLQSGDRWPQSIEEALSDCASGLLLLTEAFSKSHVCEAEYVHLLRAGKTVQIAVSGTPPIPFMLRIFQFVYLDAGFDRAVDLLSSSINLAKPILHVATPEDVQRGAAGRLTPLNEAVVRSVRLILEMSIDVFRAAANRFVRALSRLLGIEDDDIQILDVRSGSTVVTLRLPEAAAIQLVNLVERHPNLLEGYPIRAAKVLSAATHLEIVRPGRTYARPAPSEAEVATLRSSSFLEFVKLVTRLLFANSEVRPRAADFTRLYQSMQGMPVGEIPAMRSLLEDWHATFVERSKK